MGDNVFIDSNVLLYCYSVTEHRKKVISRKLISGKNSFISTQVLTELVNIITRKFNYNYLDARTAIHESCQNNNLHINTSQTILHACLIAKKYSFSFYDSLIVAASLESNCTVLYSEDMQHNQVIEKSLKIVNPFS